MITKAKYIAFTDPAGNTSNTTIKATIKDSGSSHVNSETQIKDSGSSHDEHIKTQSVARTLKNSGRRRAHSHLSFERQQNTKSSQFSKTGPPRRLQMKP